MRTLQEQIQILYEIAIAIGGTMDRQQMLKKSIKTILRKLNGLGCVILAKREYSNKLILEEIFAMPRNIKHNTMYSEIVGGLLKNPENTQNYEYNVIELKEKAGTIYSYRFNLPGYGLFILFKARELDTTFIQSFQPVCNKLAESCIACENATALANSRENLRITLKSIGDAVIATDIQGVITQMNPIAERLTGWSFRAAKGKPLDEIFRIYNAKTNEAAKNPVNQVLKYGKIVGLANHTILYSKSGVQYHIADSAAPIIDAQNLVTGVVLIFRDMTKEYQMQDALQKQNKAYEKLNNELMDINQQLRIAKQKAEQSDQLKSAFLNNISHEFRTPLNGILGFSDLLTDPTKTTEQRKNYSKMLMDSSQQLLDIVTDIVEIAQIQSNNAKIHIETFDLQNIIYKIIETTKPKIEKKGLNFQFINTTTNGENLIISDKEKIFRSIKHLIDNAVKFTHKGSIELKCTKNENTIEISVADTGIGMLPEIQEIIFEPFRQAELNVSTSSGGNGLGLTLVKSYIEMLGGQVHLHSVHQQGTKVTISLPTEKTQETAPPETPKNEKSSKGDIQTILIVEDEEINSMYLEELLLETGNKIIHAKNGQEAVDICKSNKEINLILMDIKMPVMDGYEAIKQIKKERMDIPVIAQTAYALKKDENKIRNSGFTDYLSKPIKQKKLLETIQKHL